MRSTFISLLTLVSLLCMVTSGWSQTGGFDRSLRQILIGPADAAGDRAISAWVDFHAPASTAVVDMSFEAEVQVTRDRVVVYSFVRSFSVQTDGNVGDCLGSCGGGCGGLYVDGALNTMTCHIDGMLPGGGVDCDCGYWLSADMGTTNLNNRDEIMVLLRPAPGAFPDDDPNNEIQFLTFDGDVSGWNRGVTSVDVLPNAAGGNDLHASFFAAVSDASLFHELSFDVDVLLNGLVIVTNYVPLHVVPVSATDACDAVCAGGTCADYQSEDPQQWIAPACAFYPGFANCNCGSTLDLVIPDIGPVDPTDELMILLRPAPGALPELPGFPDDDQKERPRPTGAPNARDLQVRLGQNSPNPFNPATTIEFELATSAAVSFDVYDLRGQHVRQLVRSELGAGRHEVTWNGLDDSGRSVASGTYFFRLRGEGFDVSKSGVLVK